MCILRSLQTIIREVAKSLSNTTEQLTLPWVFQMAPVVKNLPASAGDMRDMGSIPGLGRSPGVGNGNPFRILAWKIPRAQEPGYSPWSCKQSDMIE